MLAIATLVGCQSTRTESYSVELHNASDQPITVWVTKTGDHDQEAWFAPEDLSTSRAASVGQINGDVIPPGRTGTFGPIAGQFGWEDLAMLRVYAGKLSLDQILATPEDGKLRVDVPLAEGMNRLTVHSPPLVVTRANGETVSSSSPEAGK